jgi:hypothetical protein
VGCRLSQAPDQIPYQFTGVEVREAVAEIEPATGAVVQAFTSIAMVKFFRLSQSVPRDSWSSPEEQE